MENLQQIVVQETTSTYVRALAQYGTSFMPEKQVEVIYSELSVEDQAIWDAFVTMIKTK
jgi:hypothetical protein